MSLIRLLTVNRTVNAAKDEPHRYRKTYSIPKFIPNKRPVLPAPIIMGQKKETVMQQTESLFDAPKPSNAVETESLANLPGVLSVGVFPKVQSTAFPPVEEPKRGWFQKILNLFRRKKAPELTAPVQTEWSLDLVTVVRNDLSDSDFEVVVAKAGAVPEKVKGKNLVGRAWKKAEVSVANPEPVDTLK